MTTDSEREVFTLDATNPRARLRAGKWKVGIWCSRSSRSVLCHTWMKEAKTIALRTVPFGPEYRLSLVRPTVWDQSTAPLELDKETVLEASAAAWPEGWELVIVPFEDPPELGRARLLAARTGVTATAQPN